MGDHDGQARSWQQPGEPGPQDPEYSPSQGTLELHQLLRRGMNMLDEDLHNETPSRVESSAGVVELPTHNRKRWALPGVAAAAVLAGGVLIMTQSAHPETTVVNPPATGGDKVAAQTWAGFISCQEMILTGIVTAVVPSPTKANHQIVAVSGADWIKPAQGAPIATIELVDPAYPPRDPGPDDPSFKIGEKALISVPIKNENLDRASVWYGDAISKTRAKIDRALDKSKEFDCGSSPRNGRRGPS